MFPLNSLIYIAVWGLQEAAVLAEDFAAGVTGQGFEGLAAVDDGHVEGGHVAEEEGAGGVDGAEVDFGVGAGFDSYLFKSVRYLRKKDDLFQWRRIEFGLRSKCDDGSKALE